VGHNYNSEATFHKGREIYQSGQLGKVTNIRLIFDRTRKWPQWVVLPEFRDYAIPADANAETIDWERYMRAAPVKREFDVERFFLWRHWWEYGTGIAGDLMSHMWDSANMVTGMGIPETAVTHGGNYFWKDGRDVTDTWNVFFDYPKQDLMVSYLCTFSNGHNGDVEQYLGRDLTLELNSRCCRTFVAEWKDEIKQQRAKAEAMAKQVGIAVRDFKAPPVYTMGRGELDITSHWQNFIDCVRSRAVPRCGIDRAFQVAVAVFMSVEAYKRDRKVRWDPQAETIV
jgi:predicted dehydrogenase